MLLAPLRDLVAPDDRKPLHTIQADAERVLADLYGPSWRSSRRNPQPSRAATLLGPLLAPRVGNDGMTQRTASDRHPGWHWRHHPGDAWRPVSARVLLDTLVSEVDALAVEGRQGGEDPDESFHGLSSLQGRERTFAPRNVALVYLRS